MNEQQNKKLSSPTRGKRHSGQVSGTQNAAGPQSRAAKSRNMTGNATRKPRAPRAKAATLKMYPLGGLGEIGKNITVYECAGDMLVVDCGGCFPESDMYGIDLVIPDFTFLEQNREKIRGIVITHGHEDHIGALPYLLREINVPIYGTRLTMGLIENKLEEHGLLSSTQRHRIVPRQTVKLGCFQVDPISVNHSIPDAVAFAITCPAGVVMHTGDWKIDYTPAGGKPFDLAAFSEYGAKGVLALVSDSTNSERPGNSTSESVVNAGLAALFARAEKKRVIVATFASNLYRVQLLIDLAVKHGRKVAISGRSMIKNTQMAIELGYLRAPDGILIDINKTDKMPPEQVTIITTGSQGETLSALARMASNSHRNVHVGRGDFIIISATPIPGNEKMVTRVVNNLLKLGADVIYENMYDVHASGHACQEEQKLIINLTQPKYFLPVHGEYKHLKRHAQTAQDMGISESNILIPDTGEGILLSEDKLAVIDGVPAGSVMVDGLGVGDVGSVVLRDRRLLSEDGIVVLVATVDVKKGKLVCEPEIFTRGFVYVRDSEALLEETRAAVEKVLKKMQKEMHRDVNSMKTMVRETASSLLYRKTKRSPMILPVIMEV